MNAGRRTGALALALALAAAGTHGQRDLGAEVVPPPVPRPDEERVVQKSLPDIPVTLADGRQVALSSLWRERPLFLTLVFTRCYGVCSPFLRTVRSVADDVGGTGADYNIVALSFDSRDTADELSIMAGSAGAKDRAGWYFALASPADIARLTQAIGFEYKWNEATQQFDHPATLVGVDRGRVVRLLTGGAVSPARFREMLAEMRGEFVPIYPAQDGVRFRCFEFRADGIPRPAPGMLLLIAPAIITLLLVAAFFYVIRRNTGAPESKPASGIADANAASPATHRPHEKRLRMPLQ